MVVLDGAPSGGSRECAENAIPRAALGIRQGPAPAAAWESVAVARPEDEPVGPDVTDFLATENVQEILEGRRRKWTAELAADKKLNQPAREAILGQRMRTLKEELVEDRPDRYLDQTELARRYHGFPRSSLTPEQRKAVEAVYGPPHPFWNPDD